MFFFWSLGYSRNLMHALLPVCCPYSVVSDCCDSQEQNVNQTLVAIFGLVLLVQGGHHYWASQVGATIVRQIQPWPTHSAVSLCSACIYSTALPTCLLFVSSRASSPHVSCTGQDNLLSYQLMLFKWQLFAGPYPLPLTLSPYHHVNWY